MRWSPDAIPSTIPDVLTRRAAQTPDALAYSFLADGETLTEAVSFADLHRRVQALARHLVAHTQPGDRILLLYPPGIDYVVAVIGCLCAGRVAVPAYPPKPRRPDARLAALVADCAPSLTLTDEGTAARLASSDDPLAQSLPAMAGWSGTCARATQAGPALPRPDPDDVALLQYTSGSTAQPKGVVLTHGNLVANIDAIRAQFGLEENSVALSWLPPYHDMGLIGFVFGALYIGCHLVLMPPASFVQRPLRWLQAIDRFRVVISGAPNFGYEQCLRKIGPAERAALDLRSWKCALNGAEPVSAATLQQFAEAFAVAGFDANALAPCYGLAEATLLVTGKPAGTATVTGRFDETALGANEARAAQASAETAGCHLVSSGRVAAGTTVLIVEAEGIAPLAEGRVGEICIAGAGVTRGYWNPSTNTPELFLDRDGTRYLRTGDLGFLREGELFVTGRIKDLVILRGRNHYPQDIELTAGHAHALVQPGAAAAFSVTVDGEEQLVVVSEVTRAFRAPQAGAVSAAINEAISAQHGIVPHAVALLRPACLPRTSSGKVRRRACREMWLDRTLPLTETAADTKTVPAPAPRPASASARNPRSAATADALITWLREYGATRINSRVIDERRTIPPYVVLDFGNRGLMGLQVAEAFGGLDLSHVDALRVMEQVSAIDLTLASMLGVHQALGTRPIKHFASADRQRELLPAVATGRELAAFALTEPAAGSNPLALQTRAVPQTDGTWKLHGEKEWIGLASWAGVITVFAQLYDSSHRPRGITAFVVRQGAPGLRHGPEALTMGVRGMVQNRLYLDGVPVTADDMLGAPGDGMRVAQDAMMYGRLGLGVMSLAAMKRSAQLMLHYAGARTISTGRLLDNPVTLTRLNTHTAAIEATESLVYGLARWLDAGIAVPPECFMAVKITAPELLGRAVDDLVQLLGGRGYIETNLVPQLLRDARLIRIFEGPTETLAMALGTYLVRDARPLLRFVETHLPRGGTAARLEALMAQCVAPGTTPHAWTVYQLGEYAAYALLLATTHQHAAAHSSAGTVRWLERLLAEREVKLLGQAFHDIAPASADELSQRIARYAQSIGDGAQSLPGEDTQPDPLVLGRTVAAPAMAAARPDTAAVDASRESARPSEPVLEALRRYLGPLLRLPPEDIDAHRPLVHYGLDSLALVELQFHVEKSFGHTVSAEAFFDQLTLHGLASRIAAADGAMPSPADDGPIVASPAVPAPPALPVATLPIVPRAIAAEAPRADPALPSSRGPDFSLFFFSDNAAADRANPYQLLLDAARYADSAGFTAVWVPERHFHRFGGLYPNPSVVASALSMVTRKVRLRAGSVVLPLHHPVRVAEEWAVVDNLSGGRVDLAFTPGWSVNDFALAQDRYATRLDDMLESLRIFETLWRGGTGSFTNGAGEPVELSVFPRPHSADRTVWLTCTRGRERFEKAGELGANVLTALLMQTTGELADNIAAYRASRARHGFDPDRGVVTLMLHTYLGEDLSEVRELVREPLHDYLLSSIQLWGLTERSLEQLSPTERGRVIDAALERYLRTSSLIGTVDTALDTVRQMQDLGVNEIACLVDFGIDDARTLAGLRAIGRLRDRCRTDVTARTDAPVGASAHASPADPAVVDAPLPFF